MTKSSRSLILFSAAFYLLLVCLITGSMLHKTEHHFVYALDDPYIHLAMAENLAHGHYGINPTEMTSPASSILWPFLLIPFAGTALHAYVPLLWNLLFGVVAAGLLGYAVSKWPPQVDERGRMAWWQQAMTAALLVLTANLASLTIVGMEHVLQVLLAICCAIGCAEALSERPVPAWCVAAAVVAPMVRYEDLSLTLALCIALAGLGLWKKAAAVFAASLVPLVGFSAYLKSNGLPALPMSVLVKGSAFGNESVAAKAVRLIHDSVHEDVTSAVRYPVTALFLIFVGLTVTATTRVRRFVFGGAAALGGLQLTIGRFNWFHRYEVYALIFLTLLCLRVLAERPRFFFGFYALALLFCAAPYMEGTAQTSTASRDVYEQQYQMRRFVKEFYDGDYAVNDLGLVSFDRRPGAYVLDVYGLASVEASRQPDKSAAWLADVVKRHGVRLAIVYPNWFHIPDAWTPVAKMCGQGVPVMLSSSCVVLYSTAPEEDDPLRTEVMRFAPTLPAGMELFYGRGRGDDVLWTAAEGN